MGAANNPNAALPIGPSSRITCTVSSAPLLGLTPSILIAHTAPRQSELGVAPTMWSRDVWVENAKNVGVNPTSRGTASSRGRDVITARCVRVGSARACGSAPRVPKANASQRDVRTV